MRHQIKIAFFVLLIASAGSLAGSLAAGHARTAAEHFLQRFAPGTARSVSEVERNSSARTDVEYYIVHLKPAGFVLLSSNHDASPVIAYSFSHDYDGGQSGPLQQFIEEDIRLNKSYGLVATEMEKQANRAAWRRLSRRDEPALESRQPEQWPPQGTTATGGWVETTWHQKAPYNSLCPIDPETGERSLVGCVATAMAQIINFHRFLSEPILSFADAYAQGSPAISYDLDSKLFDFPSFAEMNKYAKRLEKRFAAEEPLTQQDAAALLFLCGLLTETEFSSANSTTFTNRVATALTNRLGYSNARRLDFREETFFETMIANIRNGQPVQLAMDQQKLVDGHSAVVDGYNSDGFFHINFGWGDSLPVSIAEAWYLIPDIMADRFDLIKYAIVDIVPRQRPRPLLTADSCSVVFPSFTAIGSADVRQVTLTNIGTQDVTIDYIAAPPDFEVSAGGHFKPLLQNINLAGGGQLTLWVRFVPVSTGRSRGNIVISYNNKTTVLVLKATGYGVPEHGTGIFPGQVAGVWSKANSPYFVMGEVRVPHGQRLIIDAGVRLYFEANSHLTVASGGQLLVRGTKSDSVIFGPLDQEKGWQGIKFITSGEDDSLFFCLIGGVRNSGGEGGALYCDNSSPAIFNSVIRDNHSALGAGAYLFNSSARFENVIFHSNRADSGAAVFAKFSQAVFDNVTVADNVAGSGSAFYADTKNDLKVTNSIIFGNGPDAIAFVNGQEETNTIAVSYSDVEIHEQPGGGGKVNFGYRTIHEQPGFRSQRNRDYRLHPDSPCIDGGDPGKDIGMEPMPHGYCVNLGAYGGTADAQPSRKTTPTVAPDPVQFQMIGAYEKKWLPVVIGNGTTGTITVQSITVGQPEYFKLEGAPNSFDLAPGEKRTVWLEFTPASLEEEHIVSTFSVTSSSGTVTVPVEARSRFMGTIFGTLDLGGSPYVIHGPLRIPDWKSLVLEPGVQLLFQREGAVYVSPNATIVARGSQQAPILFDAVDPEKGWQGIVLENSTNENLFEFCLIEHVKRQNAGGAITSFNSSVRLSNSTIRRCRSYSGAAVYARDGNLDLFQCRLENNETTKRGAGLAAEDAHVVIRNSLLVGNKSTLDGGAMCLLGSFLEAVNCVFSGNKAEYKGGALCLGGGNQIWIENSILWGNDAGEGSHFSFSGKDSGPDFVFLSYSDVDTANSEWYHAGNGSAPQLEWQEGNIAADPLFVNPPAGNFYLLPGSPCIDAGNPAPEYYDPPSLSMMGKAAFPALGGVRNDLGAYGGLASTVHVEAAIDQNEALTGLSCFPNPFNERTVIQFVLKEELPITIRIFDLLGRRVRTLTDNPLEAGLHRIAWDGRDDRGWLLPSGAYLVLLKSPAANAVNKIIVLR